MSDTATFVSVREKKHREFPLRDLLIALISHKHRFVFGSRSNEKAVAILEAIDASPDECEWAERYLCGMVTADATGFMRRRPWQS